MNIYAQILNNYAKGKSVTQLKTVLSVLSNDDSVRLFDLIRGADIPTQVLVEKLESYKTLKYPDYLEPLMTTPNAFPMRTSQLKHKVMTLLPTDDVQRAANVVNKMIREHIITRGTDTRNAYVMLPGQDEPNDSAYIDAFIADDETYPITRADFKSMLYNNAPSDRRTPRQKIDYAAVKIRELIQSGEIFVEHSTVYKAGMTAPVMFSDLSELTSDSPIWFNQFMGYVDEHLSRIESKKYANEQYVENTYEKLRDYMFGKFKGDPVIDALYKGDSAYMITCIDECKDGYMEDPNVLNLYEAALRSMGEHSFKSAIESYLFYLGVNGLKSTRKRELIKMMGVLV